MGLACLSCMPKYVALSIEQPAPSGNEYGSGSELYALGLSSDHSRTSRTSRWIISICGQKFTLEQSEDTP